MVSIIFDVMYSDIKIYPIAKIKLFDMGKEKIRLKHENPKVRV